MVLNSKSSSLSMKHGITFWTGNNKGSISEGVAFGGQLKNIGDIKFVQQKKGTDTTGKI